MGVCDIPGGILPNCLRNAKGRTELFPDPGYVSAKEDPLSLDLPTRKVSSETSFSKCFVGSGHRGCSLEPVCANSYRLR